MSDHDDVRSIHKLSVYASGHHDPNAVLVFKRFSFALAAPKAKSLWIYLNPALNLDTTAILTTAKFLDACNLGLIRRRARAGAGPGTADKNASKCNQ